MVNQPASERTRCPNTDRRPHSWNVRHLIIGLSRANSNTAGQALSTSIASAFSSNRLLQHQTRVYPKHSHAPSNLPSVTVLQFETTLRPLLRLSPRCKGLFSSCKGMFDCSKSLFSTGCPLSALAATSSQLRESRTPHPKAALF